MARFSPGRTEGQPLALKSTSENVQIPAQGSNEAYHTKKRCHLFLGLVEVFMLGGGGLTKAKQYL